MGARKLPLYLMLPCCTTARNSAFSFLVKTNSMGRRPLQVSMLGTKIAIKNNKRRCGCERKKWKDHQNKLINKCLKIDHGNVSSCLLIPSNSLNVWLGEATVLSQALGLSDNKYNMSFPNMKDITALSGSVCPFQCLKFGLTNSWIN